MIWDAFIFFNELDLLELRLKELEEVVDRFVLVEAPVTFSGQLKPLHFKENKDRFSRWPIEHVIVNDMPDGDDPWKRERWQRNAIRRGLYGAARNDGIMISDLDEIPAAASVAQWRPSMGTCAFHQLYSYYWVNCVGERDALSRIMRWGDLKKTTASKARRMDGKPLDHVGWHFSYLGGPAQIRRKIDAFSHQELNTPKYTDFGHLEKCIQTGTDLYRRDGYSWRKTGLDHLPREIKNNPDRYQNWIWKP